MELKLEKNDVMLLFTDGVTEAKNNDGKFFSAQPLIKILQEAGGCTTEEIKNRVLRALRDFNTNDDVTLIIMKKL
jgi:sigma-B regulation protein RsbU (phosphoserine phosphatase)